MDLRYTDWGDSGQLTPSSALGTLWLQRQFEPSTWELVCTGAVRLRREICTQLQARAVAAGLSVEQIASVS